MLRIKLIKSPIGHNVRNRATIQALGLRKISQAVEHEDTPTIRGMIHHVHPMIQVEEVEGTPAKRNNKGTGKKVTGGPRKAEAAAAPKPKPAPKPAAVKPAAKPAAKKAEPKAKAEEPKKAAPKKAAAPKKESK